MQENQEYESEEEMVMDQEGIGIMENILEQSKNAMDSLESTHEKIRGVCVKISHLQTVEPRHEFYSQYKDFMMEMEKADKLIKKLEGENEILTNDSELDELRALVKEALESDPVEEHDDKEGRMEVEKVDQVIGDGSKKDNPEEEMQVQENEQEPKDNESEVSGDRETSLDGDTAESFVDDLQTSQEENVRKPKETEDLLLSSQETEGD